MKIPNPNLPLTHIFNFRSPLRFVLLIPSEIPPVAGCHNTVMFWMVFIISHSYKAAGDLQFKCDECDFWGPNAQTMVMHFRRNHSENISCGLCDFEAKDIETLDILNM